MVFLIHDSTKMYRRRIKQWGLDKNNKYDEVKAIVRKTKARSDQGKRSQIHVRGKTIGDGEVMRYLRRRGESIDDVVARRAASVTPEAVEIVTPVPSRVATPTSLAVPERIFTAIRDYFDGSFTSGFWGYNEKACYTRKVHEYERNNLIDLSNRSFAVCQLYTNGLYEEARPILISLTANFKKILLEEQPETLRHILGIVTDVRRLGRNEIGMVILRQFCALGEFVVGKEHPLRLICGWLASADAFQFDEIVARCFQSVVDRFESFVGPMHYSTLRARAQYIEQYIHTRDQRQELLQDLLGQCEFHLGSSDFRTWHLRYLLAHHYYDCDQHTEALKTGQDLIANVQYGQKPSLGHFHYYYSLGLTLIAVSQWNLGQTSLAEANLREAIALRVSEWGPRDSLAGLCLVHLEQLLVEMGRWSCAAEVREQRMGIWEPLEVL